MHRLIMDAKEGEQVDHKDGNGLNNTKANLRIATELQNSFNKRKTRGKSQYKGVCRDKNDIRWTASIRLKGRLNHIGNFINERMAAAAYNFHARSKFGEFAWLNPGISHSEEIEAIEWMKSQRGGTLGKYGKGIRKRKNSAQNEGWYAFIRRKGKLITKEAYSLEDAEIKHLELVEEYERTRRAA